MSHTPGPWRWVAQPSEHQLDHPANAPDVEWDGSQEMLDRGFDVLKGTDSVAWGIWCNDSTAMLTAGSVEDARLIAAAPDLEAACRAMVRAYETVVSMGGSMATFNRHFPDAAKLGYAALAKSDGRAPLTVEDRARAPLYPIDRPVTDAELTEIEGDYKYDDHRGDSGLWANRAARLVAEVRRLREEVSSLEAIRLELMERQMGSDE